MAVNRADDRPNETIGRAADELWWLFLLQGVAAVFFGIAAIFWPQLTLVTLVYLFSAFILVWGIAEIINGFMSIKRRDTWWLSLIFGLAGLGAGVYLVRHPSVSFTALILIIGLLLIGRGLLDLLGAFVGRGRSTNKILSILVGIAAIVAGIVLLFQSPEAGVAFVWILGLYALIYGALTIALAMEAREYWLGPPDISDKNDRQK